MTYGGSRICFNPDYVLISLQRMQPVGISKSASTKHPFTQMRRDKETIDNSHQNGRPKGCRNLRKGFAGSEEDRDNETIRRVVCTCQNWRQIAKRPTSFDTGPSYNPAVFQFRYRKKTSCGGWI